MGLIKSFGYIGLGATDLDAWRSFATEVLGLQVGTAPEGDDSLYLRMDGRAFRLAIEPGVDNAIHFLGFEVSSREALAELVADLRGKGLAVVEESAEVCARRRVYAMASTADAAGNRIELFVGHEEATAPFVSPTGANFVIDDMGFGHAMLMVTDIDAFVDFYANKLGFKLSDTIGGMAPGIEAIFLHCNPRHHSMAGVSVPGVPDSISHVMFQVDSLDTVGRANDEVIKRGLPIVSTLGKHTNDHMVSFYCMTPSGLIVEYGTGARRVDDDTWVVGHYTATSYWGHSRPDTMPVSA
jgi:2,3-dihydroxybiphenyl 1,2-dioxygenase